MAGARTSRSGSARGEGADGSGPTNEVVLVGRVAAPASIRALPSGDEIVNWRLVVPRDGPPRPGAAGGPTIDTIDCAAFRRQVQQAAARWVAGDIVAVRGALRRRFWRSAHGAASRYEVEVASAKVVRRASG
jgi:single-strand DNA-binding protein